MRSRGVTTKAADRPELSLNSQRAQRSKSPDHVPGQILRQQPTSLANEISSYYMRVADDYRERYLETERLLIQTRESSKMQLEQAISSTESRLNKLFDAERALHESRLKEKETVIEQLRKKVSDLE